VTTSSDPPSEKVQPKLEIFRSLPGDLAARDSQDLMADPFFSLAKSKRIEPIIFNTKRVCIRVSGSLDYGIATIWDADNAGFNMISSAMEILTSKSSQRSP
jgi:plasmid replication initiation protein